jgi:protein-disulfide isomerase
MRAVSTLNIATLSVILSACTVTIALGPDRGGEGGPKELSRVAEHDAGAMQTQTMIDNEVHDYLISHPEVIGEAQHALAMKLAADRIGQGRRAIAQNQEAVFRDGSDPVLGNPAGDVTVVAVTDYQCPYCKALTPNLDLLLAADPGIRLVIKEFPILGPGSEMAARYALASARQGQYAAFHAALMADKTPEHQLDQGRIEAIATSLGLDLMRLKTDAESPAIVAKIAANRQLVQKLGISGTPGLIFGDQIQGGVMSLDMMKKAVSEARSQKTALVP